MPRGKNYVNNHRGMALQGHSKNKSMELCFYGSACARINCIYRHVDKSSNTDGAASEQLQEPCRLDLAGLCHATASTCKKRHVTGDERQRLLIKMSITPCRFGVHCKTKNCLYKHPSSPFAIGVTNPNDAATVSDVGIGNPNPQQAPPPPLPLQDKQQETHNSSSSGAVGLPPPSPLLHPQHYLQHHHQQQHPVYPLASHPQYYVPAPSAAAWYPPVSCLPVVGPHHHHPQHYPILYPTTSSAPAPPPYVGVNSNGEIHSYHHPSQPSTLTMPPNSVSSSSSFSPFVSATPDTTTGQENATDDKGQPRLSSSSFASLNINAREFVPGVPTVASAATTTASSSSSSPSPSSSS